MVSVVDLPRNCSEAVCIASSDPSTLTCATPSTMTGTPSAVYTSGVVTSRVMISSEREWHVWKPGITKTPPPTTIFFFPRP